MSATVVVTKCDPAGQEAVTTVPSEDRVGAVVIGGGGGGGGAGGGATFLGVTNKPQLTSSISLSLN